MTYQQKLIRPIQAYAKMSDKHRVSFILPWVISIFTIVPAHTYVQ